jgi:hypothetical protein
MAGAVMEVVLMGIEVLRRVLQRTGPYLLVELLLPGGSVLALLLFLHRRKRVRIQRNRATIPSALAATVTS